MCKVVVKARLGQLFLTQRWDTCLVTLFLMQVTDIGLCCKIVLFLHVDWLYFQQEHEEFDYSYYPTSVPATTVVVPPSNKVWLYVRQNIYC